MVLLSSVTACVLACLGNNGIKGFLLSYYTRSVVGVPSQNKTVPKLYTFDGRILLERWVSLELFKKFKWNVYIVA